LQKLVYAWFWLHEVCRFGPTLPMLPSYISAIGYSQNRVLAGQAELHTAER